MGVQIIVTPTGEEMVVMSRAEYDALLQDVADAFEDGVDSATFVAALETQGPEDRLPADVSLMILQGHGRLRALRKWRSISSEELAAASRLDVSIINEIDLGRRSIDEHLATQLAEALDVPTRWLAA